MRYRLRTLLILLAAGPLVLAVCLSEKLALEIGETVHAIGGTLWEWSVLGIPVIAAAYIAAMFANHCSRRKN